MPEYELPEPPKPGLISYLKAVGPGVILASLAIGSGEWILFPAVVVSFGPYLPLGSPTLSDNPSSPSRRVDEVSGLLRSADP